MNEEKTSEGSSGSSSANLISKDENKFEGPTPPLSATSATSGNFSCFFYFNRRSSFKRLHQSRGQIIEQKLELSFNFLCEQIHSNHCYESEACSLDKSSCLAPALGVAKSIIVVVMILATLCCAT